MKRQVLNLLTATSLLLGTAVCVLWERSYVACDRITWTGDAAVMSVIAPRGWTVWSRTTGESGVAVSGEWPWLNHMEAGPLDVDAGVWADLSEGSLPGFHYSL